MDAKLERMLVALERRAKGEPKDPGGHKWKGPLPKGWTDASRKKFWDSLTGRAPKHKVTQCIKKMEGTSVSDPGAFCAALADRVIPGWREEAAKERRKKKAALHPSPEQRQEFGRRALSLNHTQDDVGRVAAALRLVAQDAAKRHRATLIQETAVLRAKFGLDQPLRTRRDYGAGDDDGTHSRVPGDDLPEQDRSSLDRRGSDGWISRKEMERLCPSCAERMRKAGFTRVRASVMRQLLLRETS